MTKFEWTRSVKTLRRPYRASQLHLHGLPKALERIRKAANRDKRMRFTCLWHHIYSIEALGNAYFSLKGNAAPGVDGETCREYGLELEDNFGVPGNSRKLVSFRYHLGRLWYKALRRRSQRSKLNWERMSRLIERWLPKVRVMHPYPDFQLYVSTRGRSPVR